MASIKEKIGMEVMSLQAENLGRTLTSSEIIEHLIEIGIVAEDGKILVGNNNYMISPNGNISFDGKILDKAEINDLSNATIVEADIHNFNDIDIAEGMTKIKLICYNGTIELYYTEDGEKKHRIDVKEIPIGKKFAYWLDQNNNIFSYNKCTDNYNIVDMEYTPVFIDENEVIEKECVVSLNAIRYKSKIEEGKQRIILSMFTMPLNGYELIEMGYIRTFSQNDKELLLENLNDSIKFIRCDGVFSSYRYRINLGVASGVKTIYMRGVAKFRNIETGEVITKYSNVLECAPVQ